MEKRYKVIFSNLLKEKDFFKYRMTMLGVPEETSEEIIKKAPIIIKKKLTLGDARRYADVLLEAGAKVTIHVDDDTERAGDYKGSSGLVTLKNFVMCPECGHKQIKANACIRCGLTFGNAV